MWLQKFANNFWNSKNMVIPWVGQGQMIIMDQLDSRGVFLGSKFDIVRFCTKPKSFDNIMLHFASNKFDIYTSAFAIEVK